MSRFSGCWVAFKTTAENMDSSASIDVAPDRVNIELPDFDMPDGSGIPIEERDPIEVTHFGSRRTAPENIKVRSPAFDVTPNHLVAGLITERGIIRPPFKENLLGEYGE